jgi:hypothetical protein
MAVISDGQWRVVEVIDSAQRAMAGDARRHRWHSWQWRHRGFCNLQNLKDVLESESHSLRQNLSLFSTTYKAAFAPAGNGSQAGPCKC